MTELSRGGSLIHPQVQRVKLGDLTQPQAAGKLTDLFESSDDIWLRKSTTKSSNKGTSGLPRNYVVFNFVKYFGNPGQEAVTQDREVMTGASM